MTIQKWYLKKPNWKLITLMAKSRCDQLTTCASMLGFFEFYRRAIWEGRRGFKTRHRDRTLHWRDIHLSSFINGCSFTCKTKRADINKFFHSWHFSATKCANFGLTSAQKLYHPSTLTDILYRWQVWNGWNNSMLAGQKYWTFGVKLFSIS